MLRAFGHRVASCCDVLAVVGSNLTIFKPEPTTPNMSQHIATRWPNARNKCCDVLRWHVAIVWPGLNVGESCYGLASRVGGSENAFSRLIQRKTWVSCYEDFYTTSDNGYTFH